MASNPAMERTTSASEVESEVSEVTEDFEMSETLDSMEGNLSRGPVFTSVISGAMGHEDSPTKSTKPRCTPEVKALALSAGLFTTITSFQIYAAQMAHSRALLMDCISSGVDALTFMGNIVVECKKRDGRRHATSQLLVVAASLGLLSFFTINAMRGSYEAALLCQEGIRMDTAAEDEVNGWITLGFALGNMVFDCICLLNFLKSHRQTGSGKHVNMFSAFLHVGADFLRAFTTLVMSLLILATSWESTCLDAYSSMVIGVTILAGILVGLWKWFRLLLSLFKRGQ